MVKRRRSLVVISTIFVTHGAFSSEQTYVTDLMLITLPVGGQTLKLTIRLNLNIPRINSLYISTDMVSSQMRTRTHTYIFAQI